MKNKYYSWAFLSIACLLLGWGVVFHRSHSALLFHPEIQHNYLENKTNTLNVLLYCNSSDYFLYRGTPIGFQYDLIKIMCDSLHKEVVFTFSTNPDDIKKNFFTSKYDIIAIDVDTTKEGKEDLAFSLPHSSSYPVLIQRADGHTAHPKILYVPAHFPGQIRLDSLPISETWSLERSSRMAAEEFFELLQDGKIDYLISDYNTAITLLPFFPDLTIAKQMGPTYWRRWILNPANVKHNEAINDWLCRFIKSPDYHKLCNKYFSSNSKYLHRASVEKRTGRISSYDKIIKRYAAQYQLDWRFVSSIIYQESRFSGESVGIGGSFGIMQLMPATAQRYGVDSTSTIEQQILAGVRLISSLNKLFLDIEDVTERMFFVAASYNAGPGHIIDARKLCQKYGGDDKLWRDVESYLALKTEREFYSDPVVQNGYYPGKHTIRYTNRVMDRYQAYKVSLSHR